MLLNVHSYYSLRYGTLSPEALIQQMQGAGYDTAVLTDINTSSGIFEWVKAAREAGFNALAGMEFRNGDRLCFTGIAKNEQGFQELNELCSEGNLKGLKRPDTAPEFEHVSVVYPLGSRPPGDLRDFEFIGVMPSQLNKLRTGVSRDLSRYVMWQPLTFRDEVGQRLHRQLRAIDHNLLLSQLVPGQYAGPDEQLMPMSSLLNSFKDFPAIITNTRKLLEDCCFDPDLKANKNRKTYTGRAYNDRELLRNLAMDGWKSRYGKHHQEALLRVKKELAIIDELGFSAYFLIAWDIIRYSQSRGFYHVGRGSGANSVVAYCLGITDVCPIELDLYFERFLNPKRKSPPDFDIDYSWKDRDDVQHYIFNRYGHRHTALLGTMSTFKDRSIIRELGKVYGLPKGEIDLLVNEPQAIANKHEVAELILSVYKQIEEFPNLRSIHAGGIMISEKPITAYTALDLPPKGFPTTHFDMYAAEDIHFDKLDILSQRGIGHIKEAAEIILKNRQVKVDVHDVAAFKKDERVREQLKSADTIGCFYIESPAMRGLLKKLECDDYLTLVAASSIIRPGVSKSGMMKSYIYRYHNPDKFEYLHPVMEQQLKETYGVMVYQEDVLKVGHHFGGLDLADADVLRRMMSGKTRNRKHLEAIEQKYYSNCQSFGYTEALAKEVWRQIESFAGYSFSKAHSASYAVESYQSLYLKAHYPLEFMTAVINNFGGFYSTRVYVNEARKAGGQIHLPCVNKSAYATSIEGVDIYLGLAHIQGLEADIAHAIPLELALNGPFSGLEDFAGRMRIGLAQLVILIRIGALRFTGKNKKQLLWAAHALLGRQHQQVRTAALFETPMREYQLPAFTENVLEDAYDEMELLGFPVSVTPFELLRTDYRGDVLTRDLMQHLNKTVRMVGHFVASKQVYTVRGQIMNFGTFMDVEHRFFDTVHFPPSLAHSPFKGHGTYLLQGRVVEEFGFPSIEIDRMGKLPVKGDPRTE